MEYSNSRLREICDDYIHDRRDREIFYQRYAENLTIEKLAEEHELSVSQVKRIIKKHYMPVFRHMG